MIQVEHLTKRYGGHTAVDDISFTVEDGCIYGLLGPNGAGKSTTMNIITGYLSATDGTVTINGHDIAEEPAAAKACIGYLPEQPPLYQDMTVREYLLFVAELKGTALKAESSHAGRSWNSTTSTTAPAPNTPRPTGRLLQSTPTSTAAMSSTTKNTMSASRLPLVNMVLMPFIR